MWRCEEGHTHCVGSIAELRERAAGDVPEDLELHRPYVDDVVLACRTCGGAMRRVDEVIDAWFDSGSMPFAQWHYPFENEDLFAERFPADYIGEAIDQTRGWFYSLHALSVLLKDTPCYRNVICLGHILDSKGEKMSKSKGNVVDPWSVINHPRRRRRAAGTCTPAHRRRATRAASPRELVGEGVRQFLLPLWNTYRLLPRRRH